MEKIILSSDESDSNSSTSKKRKAHSPASTNHLIIKKRRTIRKIITESQLNLQTVELRRKERERLFRLSQNPKMDSIDSSIRTAEFKDSHWSFFVIRKTRQSDHCRNGKFTRIHWGI